MKFILSITAVFVLALGILTACQKNASTTKNEMTNPSNYSVLKPNQSTPTDDAPRISLADAKKDFDAGSAIFVDTRGEAEFKKEHVQGAINIPSETLEAKLKELPKDKKIIAYCS